jgi:hypothetical protein
MKKRGSTAGKNERQAESKENVRKKKSIVIERISIQNKNLRNGGKEKSINFP